MTEQAYVPLALIAELTHRCPLHCVYCSNPIEMQKRASELSTEDWLRVIQQAADLGVVQMHFTGGEPTLRDDLLDLLRGARAHKMYTNLITSGVGLTVVKLQSYLDAGLDHIQLSIQDAEAGFANEYAGTKAHDVKMNAARMIKDAKLAFTLNMVIHRNNIARLPQMIDLGEKLGADRMEIAHVQYYGWAFKNRDRLMPSREQVKESMDIIKAAKVRLQDRMRIDIATPDYFAKFPKPCMGGWGQKSLLIDPAGQVMPCHSAMVIPGMKFVNVRDQSVADIWNKSQAFNQFRGDAWMSEPCRSCEHKTKDFGGCRCQAFLLAGDASSTDPVCSLSPRKGEIRTIIENASTVPSEAAWVYRK